MAAVEFRSLASHSTTETRAPTESASPTSPAGCGTSPPKPLMAMMNGRFATILTDAAAASVASGVATLALAIHAGKRLTGAPE